jgi:ppGpp synthetase/RelA/SpoT-type nucleotidyltranferase
MHTADEVSWINKQVGAFTQKQDALKAFDHWMYEVLKPASRTYAPHSIVMTRVKSIPSFIEKCWRRKKIGIENPVDQFTDLCGARVITHAIDHVKAMSRFVEEIFEIDWNNSYDVSQRRKHTEFGYRSIHYIVSFKSKVVTTPWGDITIDDKALGVRGEIQIRTFLEHAWADFSHTTFYKSQFSIPDHVRREFNALSASLEYIDSAFSAIKERLRTYLSNFGTYMKPEEMKREIANLECALKYDTTNIELAARLGKLAIACEDWDKAIAVLTPFVDARYQPICRDYGNALFMKYQKNPSSPEFKKAQECLECASHPKHQDSDAAAIYAGTWKNIDPAKARELYRKAYEIDSSNPFPLGKYIEYEVASSKSITVISMLRPSIERALQRCRDQADAQINLPWAYFDMGKFHLLLNDPYESLIDYAKALQLAPMPGYITSAYGSLQRLESIKGEIKGYDWVRMLLLLGMVLKFPDYKESAETGSGRPAQGFNPREELEKMKSGTSLPFSETSIIITGGIDMFNSAQFNECNTFLVDAFLGYKGNIVITNTDNKISELVKNILTVHKGLINLIAYTPDQYKTPSGENPAQPKVINCVTGEKEYSPLELLQFITDLVTAGIDPREVSIFGIGGDVIEAVEYRVALALDMQVALLNQSGNEASKIFTDNDWKTSEKLLTLPNDPMVVRAFIGSRKKGMQTTSLFNITHIKKIATKIHEDFRQESMAKMEWNKLSDDEKRSNVEQAGHIFEKLNYLGYTIQFAEGDQPNIIQLTPDEINVLARMEHGRWVVERTLAGWRFGETLDRKNKTHPFLKGWNDISEERKELNRKMVRKIPTYLESVQFEMVKNKVDAIGK